VPSLVDRLPASLRHFVDRVRDEDVLLSAAGLAFYALVSVAPLTVLSLRLAALLVGADTVRQAGEALAKAAPEKLGVDTMFAAVTRTGTGLGPTAVLAALWPATAYGSGLVRAFDRVSGNQRRMQGLRGRLLAFVLLGLLPLFVLLALAAVAFGPRLLGDSGAAEAAGWFLAVALALAMVTAFHVVVYRVFAPERPAMGDVVRGALASAGAVSVVSLAYAAYLRFGADFGTRYVTSGLAAVVLLAVWLFLGNAFLLVGYCGVVSRPAPGRGGST
jgi:membrane protein